MKYFLVLIIQKIMTYIQKGEAIIEKKTVWDNRLKLYRFFVVVVE